MVKAVLVIGSSLDTTDTVNWNIPYEMLFIDDANPDPNNVQRRLTGEAVISIALSPKRADDAIRQAATDHLLALRSVVVDPDSIYIPFAR